MENIGMENGQNLPIADSRIKILVVDDHPNMAEMLARAISRLDNEWDVVSATSGDEALKLDKEKPANIVITDVMMPDMSGLELAETIRSRHEEHSFVIFLMSAYSTPELMESAEYLKIKQVFRKPINPDVIHEIIQETINKMKQEAQPIGAEHVKASIAGRKDDSGELNRNQAI